MLKSNGQAIPAIVIFILLALGSTACNTAKASEEEIEARWQTSAHADSESRSFTRWNDEDPPEIPERCAKCHSTHGYRDFLGLEGATAGQVNKPAPVGTTIECEACHNKVAGNKTGAMMPSGMELSGLTQEANCMECHQGRASGVQVNEAIAGLPLDKVNTELSLPNIHNNPAGPILFGTQAHGGFEYEGRDYLDRYLHVIQFETCQQCHDAHSLGIKVEQCSACHRGANSVKALANIRTSNIDYDGDGNIAEGMAGEIATMQDRLLLAMKAYAALAEGVDDIEYDGGFIDANGEKDSTWTPRLLKAAHNFRMAALDPGSYAHNGRYIIQLHYDSLADLDANIFGMIRPE
jgi:hypothetical protein